MKKVLALVLAVVLAFGMCTVAFAAAEDVDVGTGTGAGPGTYVNKAKDLRFADSGNAGIVSAYNKDGDVITSTKPGVTYYIPLQVWTGKPADNAVPGAFAKASKLSDADNYKISVTNDGDKSIFASAKFEVKNFKSGSAASALCGTNKNLCLAVSTNNNMIDEDQDLNLTVKLNSKHGEDASLIANFNKILNYAEKEVTTATTLNDGTYFLTFEDIEDDATLYFSDEQDAEYYIPKAASQKKTFVSYNNDEIEAVSNKYPDADLVFYNFKTRAKDVFRGNNNKLTLSGAAATVDKNGNAIAPFLYEFKAGKLNAVKADYDEDAETFTLKTNTLGQYIVSATELKATTAATEEPAVKDPTTTTGNPDTGANDFVGLAVALAVVSMAGIAVAKKH